MELPYFSFVIPIYNVELYLERCLRSVLQQTNQFWEAILVDDGSLDGSTKIAVAFAEADPRFQYLRQDNQGLGPARNAGFRRTRGTFVLFLDSDDWIDTRLLEVCNQVLQRERLDMLQFGFAAVSTEEVASEAANARGYQVHLPRRAFQAVNSCAWNKVYRRDFLESSNLNYPPIFHEDEAETYRLLSLGPLVGTIDNILHYYRRHAGSITGLSVNSRTLDYLRVVEYWEAAKASAPLFRIELEKRQFDLLNQCCEIWSKLDEPWAQDGLLAAKSRIQDLLPVLEDNPYYFLNFQWEKELARSRIYRFGKWLRRIFRRN